MFEEMVCYCLDPGYSLELGNTQFGPLQRRHGLRVMDSELADDRCDSVYAHTCGTVNTILVVEYVWLSPWRVPAHTVQSHTH